MVCARHRPTVSPQQSRDGLDILIAMMKHDPFSIETPDGSFSATLVGATDMRRPGLVMIPEIFGINRSLLDMAEGFARQGFVVLALDIFWRLQPNTNLGYAPEDFTVARRLHTQFDYAPGVRDMQAGIDTLRRHPSCNGKVGVVGYCLGGTMAYLAAARTDSDASSGYYGTRIDKFLDEGRTIGRPLMLHLGRLDHRTPPPIMGAILAAIEGNTNAQPFIYENARHGFGNHTRPDVYDAEAMQTANERSVAFFRKHLS
jgi:carboxymethylenebutenolidase